MKLKSKPAIISTALAVIAAGTVAALLRGTRPLPESASTAPPMPPMAGTLTRGEDPKAVFQRAFWRRPAEEDHILHAERREWADEGKETTHWQWFIAMEPGAAFTAWLKESNPFALQLRRENVSFRTHANVPAWFPAAAAPDAYEIHQAEGGQMTLLFSRQQNLLYATDAGKGFQKSVH
ncbi:MAG: hypothetical protein V4726_04350 [Verrucomicrobiota bacterium]